MTLLAWPTSSASSEPEPTPPAGASLVPAAAGSVPCAACGEDEAEDGEEFCTYCLRGMEPDLDWAYDAWREQRAFGDDW